MSLVKKYISAYSSSSLSLEENLFLVEDKYTAGTFYNISGDVLQGLILEGNSINTGTNTILTTGSTNIDDSNIDGSAGIDASKIANGIVSNTEFQSLNGSTSRIQPQIDYLNAVVSGLPENRYTATFLVTTSSGDSSIISYTNILTAAGLATSLENSIDPQSFSIISLKLANVSNYTEQIFDLTDVDYQVSTVSATRPYLSTMQFTVSETSGKSYYVTVNFATADAT